MIDDFMTLLLSEEEGKVRKSMRDRLVTLSFHRKSVLDLETATEKDLDRLAEILAAKDAFLLELMNA